MELRSADTGDHDEPSIIPESAPSAPVLPVMRQDVAEATRARGARSFPLFVGGLAARRLRLPSGSCADSLASGTDAVTDVFGC